MHDAVGDRADLLIEGHGRFDVPTAIRVGRALEAFDVLWFEEPIPPGNLQGLAEIRRRVRVPIAAGERLYSRWDFRECFRLECVDYAQPDVSHAGGMGRCARSRRWPNAFRFRSARTTPAGRWPTRRRSRSRPARPISTCWRRCSATCRTRSEVCSEQVRIVEGTMAIGDAPGLGVDLDEAGIARYPYQVHNLRHYTGALTDIRPQDAGTYYGQE